MQPIQGKLKGEVIRSSEIPDDLRVGKSCLYSGGYWHGSWHCQECSLISSNVKNVFEINTTKSVCRSLKRRGACHSFGQYSRNSPPMTFSRYDPTSSTEIEVRTLRKIQETNIFYEKQPLCTVQSPYCFDLSKCHEDVLTMYTNGTREAISLLDYAGNASQQLKRVDRYDDACLTITFKDTYSSIEALRGARHWQKGGKNNLLWYLNQFKYRDSFSGDSNIPNFHVERAAVASETLNRPSLRPYFDQVVPLPRRWGRPSAPEHVDIHRERKWLLTFRGNIVGSNGVPYYQHRWLAAEYWEDAPDILVDVQCKRWGRKEAYKKYNLPTTFFADMMWNSTFGFAPGGAGMGSYRFSEMLSTATIPVVVDDFIPPLYPEIDWSGCIVWVSEARIVDLPRMLRSISVDEISRRQKRCWHLHRLVLGERRMDDRNSWKDDPRVTFTLAMDIWAARVSQAMQTERLLDALQHNSTDR